MLTQGKKRHRINSRNLNKIQRILAYFKYAFPVLRSFSVGGFVVLRYFKYVFIIFIFIFLFSGYFPHSFVNKFLGAEDELNDTINFYAFKANTDTPKDLIQTGWHSAEKSLSYPQMGPESSMIDFSGDNSAFYSGGFFNLSFSGFDFLREGAVRRMPDEESENFEDKSSDAEAMEGGEEDENLEDKFQNGDDFEFENEEKVEGDEDDRNLEDNKEDEFQNGDDAELEIMVDEENFQKMEHEELSDEEVLDKIEEDEIDESILEFQNNEELEVEIIIVEEDDDAVVSVEEVEETEGDDEVEIEVEELIINDDSSDAKDMEDRSSDVDTFENESETTEDGEISFFQNIKNNLGKLYVSAQELVSSEIDSAQDFGEFKSAKIKFSLALGSVGKMIENETQQVSDEVLSDEEMEVEDLDDKKEDIEDQNDKEKNDNELEIENLLDNEKEIEETESVDQQILDEPQTNDGEIEILEIEELFDIEILEEGAEDETVDADELLELEDFSNMIDSVESGDESFDVEVLEEELDEEIMEDVEIEDFSNTEVLKNETEKESFDVEAVEDDENLLLSFMQKVQAQEGSVNDSKIVIWYAIKNASSSSDEDYKLIWKKLDTVSADNISNYLNQDYLSYDADFLNSWEDVENLQIKLEGLVAGETDFLFYLDSLWVEAEYERSEKYDKILKRMEWEKAFEMLSTRIDFSATEDSQFVFKYTKKKTKIIESISEFFGRNQYWEDVRIDVSVHEKLKGEKLDIPITIIFGDDGEFSVDLGGLQEKFKPGEYYLKFAIEDASDGELEVLELTQDFSWGVLALNFNKSEYLPLEVAFLQMAVLDERGHTICDADLEMEIIAPFGTRMTLSTEDGTIIRNPLCGPNNVIDEPDYYTYYDIAGAGEYNVSLIASTTNGIKNIQDKFYVRNDIEFEIERVGPTRIYPLAPYNMTFNILANKNYEGTIEESLPENFEVLSQSVKIKKASSTEFVFYETIVATSSDLLRFRQKTDEEDSKLIWENFKIEAGDELQINYLFDAPDISPELFLLGPLSLDEQSEIRQWQIASDAVEIQLGTGGVNTGWTDAAYSWDNTHGTNAWRDIPSKNVDDSGAYIDITSNDATNLGGAITVVEIGVEAHVETTLVDLYFLPRFDGTDAGTVNIVDGTVVGTTDTDTIIYHDVTNDSAGPGTGNWVWQDVIDLDVRVYGRNTYNPTYLMLYIDQVYIRVTYDANSAPTGSFVSAVERVGNTGVVDISIQTDDVNYEDLKAKLEYVAGDTCDFTTPLDPTLDETDANATSTYDDAIIDNDEEYQIGSSTGWITATSSGANTVNFDWLSNDDVVDEEGTYCLGLTVSDGVATSTFATTTLVLDNKAPTVPGDLIGTSTTKNSITLEFGATSTDLHFDEYRIYYATSSGVDESDYLHSSTTDINLDDVLFNGNATTTIFSLLEDTSYYFVIYAYDTYGHISSSSEISYTTNKAPFGEFNSVSLKTDGSHVADIEIAVDDLNNDNSRAKIEYVMGADCNFASPLDPTLDETQSNISSTYGVPGINNTLNYQIGYTDAWIQTPATNTIAFDWQTDVDESDADGIYCLRLTVNDLSDDQNILATTTLTIDNVAPTVSGPLSNGGVSSSTINLILGATSTESNFLYYKIFYKIGTSSVSESDTSHVDSDLNNILFNGSTEILVEDLLTDTDYVFNIYTYDSYGNISSSTEITIKTNSSVTNTSLVFINPQVSNYVIANGESAWIFRAIVHEDNGWNNMDVVKLRLADFDDSESPYSDLEFIWNQSTDEFSEIGTDNYSSASLSPLSSSNCSGNDCTLDFNLIFNHQFATTSLDYSAELYSTNDAAAYHESSYTDIYQVRAIRVEQIHYRFRNDDGGE